MTGRERGRAALRRPLLVGLTVLLAAGAVAIGLTLVPRGASPSAVVLVTIDTLRADFVSFSGRVRFRTTPFLDKLAREGVVFTEAHAPSSWTAPSMASLFTSKAPTSHGIVSGRIREEASSFRQAVLPASLTTLAESFQKAGYVTVGVPANRHLASALGFAQGFDFYYGDANFMIAPKVNRQVRIQLRSAFGKHWKQTWKTRPTFLWIHYFDPHDPYFARKPWIDRYGPEFETNRSAFPAGLPMRELRRRFPAPNAEAAASIEPLYGAEVSYVDERFRRLSKQLGLDHDNVLLIVTSDHGEEIAEHGGLGHGHGLYQEQVHVPLLVHWPAALSGGRRIDTPVSLLDVYPTLVELLGLTTPPGLQGESLVPHLRGQDQQRGPIHFTVRFEHQSPIPALQGIRHGEWKLIREHGSGERVQLFNLARDPREQHDLAADHNATVRQLEASLEHWLGTLPPPPEDLSSRLIDDEPLKEQLRALGYLD